MLREASETFGLLSYIKDNQEIVKTSQGSVLEQTWWDEIRNFQFLTMLNTDLKILIKVLAKLLLTVLPCMIAPKQTCTLRDRTFQNNLQLLYTTIEKVDR